LSKSIDLVVFLYKFLLGVSRIFFGVITNRVTYDELRGPVAPVVCSRYLRNPLAPYRPFCYLELSTLATETVDERGIGFTVNSRQKIRLGVLISGRGSNLQAIIDASETGMIAARVVIVISDVADARALELARRHDIETSFIDPRLHDTGEAFDATVIDLLRKCEVELVCLAGFMRLLSPHFIREYRNRIMNIHPALLPAFRGPHAQRQALRYGAKVSGCTVHFVDEGVDTGPIIIQAAVPVLDDDTEESLSARILTYEHRIYPRAIQLFAEGRLTIEGRRVVCDGADTRQPHEQQAWGVINP